MGADVCTSHSERVAAGYPACCERPGKPAVPTTAERGGEPPPGRPVTAVRAAPPLVWRNSGGTVEHSSLHPVTVSNRRDGAFFF